MQYQNLLQVIITIYLLCVIFSCVAAPVSTSLSKTMYAKTEKNAEGTYIYASYLSIRTKRLIYKIKFNKVVLRKPVVED